MPCAVPGCVNRQAKWRRGTRTHIIPKNEPQRSKWLRKIQRHDIEPDCNIRICSLHFNESDYESPPSIAKAIGASFRIYLKRDAVPSQHLPRKGQRRAKRQRLRTSNAINTPAETVSSTTIESLLKLEPADEVTTDTGGARIVYPAISSTASTYNPTIAGSADAGKQMSFTDVFSVSGASSVNGRGEDCLRGESAGLPHKLHIKQSHITVWQVRRHDHEPSYRTVGTQALNPLKVTRGVQAGKPPQRSRGTQASLHAKSMKSVGVQR